MYSIMVVLYVIKIATVIIRRVKNFTMTVFLIFNPKLLFDHLILRNLVQNTTIKGMGVMHFDSLIQLFQTCFMFTK